MVVLVHSGAVALCRLDCQRADRPCGREAMPSLWIHGSSTTVLDAQPVTFVGNDPMLDNW